MIDEAISLSFVQSSLPAVLVQSSLPALLNPRLVDQKGVIQDVKLVVEDTHGICLGHLVPLPLPAESLVVRRILNGANVDRFPPCVRLQAVAHIEHT